MHPLHQRLAYHAIMASESTMQIRRLVSLVLVAFMLVVACSISRDDSTNPVLDA
jgi:hypothetical protein